MFRSPRDRSQIRQFIFDRHLNTKVKLDRRWKSLRSFLTIRLRFDLISEWLIVSLLIFKWSCMTPTMGSIHYISNNFISSPLESDADLQSHLQRTRSIQRLPGKWRNWRLILWRCIASSFWIFPLRLRAAECFQVLDGASSVNALTEHKTPLDCNLLVLCLWSREISIRCSWPFWTQVATERHHFLRSKWAS